MPSRPVTFNGKVFPTAARLIGAAVGLGLLTRVLVWVCTTSSDTATRIVIGLLGSLVAAPAAWLLGAFLAVLVRLQVSQLRAFAAGRARSVRQARLALALFVGLLALCAVIAIAVRGNALGAAGWVLTRLLIAVLIGGGTAFLAFWPQLFGPKVDPRMRRRYLIAAVWVTVGAFLLATEEFELGIGLLMLFAFVLAGYAKGSLNPARRDGPRFGGGVLALLYLVAAGLLWLQMTTDPTSLNTVARYAAETAIAAVLATATALMIWRHSREAGPIVRRIGTAATVLVPAYLVFLLLDDQILGGAPEVALFPLTIWLGIRLWLRMGADRRITVKAAADIVFALVLGAVLVLFLIWLANLLAMSPSEVQVLKNLASSVHAAIDLSPWIWVGIYAVLAAAHLLSALGPGKYQAIARRLASLHVVPSVKVVRRTTTMTGIGLMVVALLGLVVPPTAGPILARQIQAAYTVAAQEELKDQQEIAVYQAITSQLTNSRPQLIMLTDLVIDVHKTYAPTKKSDAATPAELDLALRLGQLQGQVIVEGRPRPAHTTGSTAADLTGPLRDAEDLQHRLAEEQHEDTVTRARDTQAETAAELGANTVTSLLDLVSLGHAEALGIVHEYLNGLAESPLGEIFLDWTRRALDKISPDKPPTAAEVVEPDPRSLANAAESNLAQARITPGELIFPAPAQVPEQPDAAIEAAVSAEDQTATVERQHAECPGCGAPDEPGEPGREEPIPEEHGP